MRFLSSAVILAKYIPGTDIPSSVVPNLTAAIGGMIIARRLASIKHAVTLNMYIV
jgi:hypothetical protein